MNMHEVRHIITCAAARRRLVQTRCGKKPSYSAKELIAKDPLEVELYDAIDSLFPSDLEELVELAKLGGLQPDSNWTTSRTVDTLYQCIDVDRHIEAGLQQKPRSKT